SRLAISPSDAPVSRRKRRRIFWKPTGTSFDTPSVPRKSRSPSASIVASRTSIPSAVATAFRVTPAHAIRASSSISPEQALRLLPPVAACRPADTSALPVSILHDAVGQPALRTQGYQGSLGSLTIA